ncbi:MAG: TonB-dependent receptor [Gemmatimonadetes bacterium]|nr:TonB-dependent receptor [Gemmatimonadota bacterium]
MDRTSPVRSAWWTTIAVLALAFSALPATARAQTGNVTGRVTDENAAPVSAAQVVVQGTRFGTLSDASGAYAIRGLPVGAYTLVVDYPGFKTAEVPVTIEAGRTANADIRLEGHAIEIAGVVASASRRPERVTDAPATVTRISTATLDNSVGNTWAGALKQVKGLDYIQVGMTSIAVNARGFNSSFNNRMLMMEDGRTAVLPESGLPVGPLSALPKVDLAGVEVLVGPGAALYGPDASNGVITLTTKDAKQYPGTTVELTGGNRSYKDVQFRQASVFADGDWSFKVAGEYQEANDWSNALKYAGATGALISEDSMGINSIDFHDQVARGEGSLVRYIGDGRIELSGGVSRTDGVGQTNVGRNQFRGWIYDFQQIRASNPNWYFSAYRTHSNSGDSYALNRYATFYTTALTPDSVRHLADWPSNGQIFAAELQNNFTLPQVLNTHLTWGGQIRRDVVTSRRQWLTDRLTGKDVVINQKGVYAQTETPLMPWLNLVLAARYDDHDKYDGQFSPKAALVFKPSAEQSLRVSYNRAFKSPTILQTDFYIPDWTPVISVLGNTAGYTVKDVNGTVLRTYPALQPEENRTWEVGYKGVLGDRLFLDVAGYYSKYKNFISPLAIVSDPFGLGYAGDAPGVQSFAYDGNGQMVTNLAGIPPLLLIYYNLGRATVKGMDAGVNYYVNPQLTLSGTLSLVDLVSTQVAAGREEATALNSPGTKWTLGATVQNLGSSQTTQSFSANLIARYVNSYYFRSGINQGVIPTFSALDLNLGYELPSLNSRLNVGISNLLVCAQDGQLQYATTDALHRNPTNRSQKCGFNVKHDEMINMPSIGTMLFVGVSYHTP